VITLALTFYSLKKAIKTVDVTTGQQLYYPNLEARVRSLIAVPKAIRTKQNTKTLTSKSFSFCLGTLCPLSFAIHQYGTCSMLRKVMCAKQNISLR
jgi:hypothetical protein